ncbi:MAG TPA: phospholipase A [Verrucomicrobiae bacterium]|nr:phospholipase A [Verrucomicrobiae bacterium]
MPRFTSLLLLLCATAAHAQTTIPEAAEPPPEPAPIRAPTDAAEKSREYGRLSFKVDPDVYSILSSVRGLSTHKSSFFYPLSYSNDFQGEKTEMVFQLSGKWRVFGTDAYIAYSQKSFWQWLNGAESSPFRETNYDPEVFYRWMPDRKAFNHWGADFGVEHESNGRPFPQSRSWNRLYVAPFQAKGKHLAYFKFWYRLPEGEASTEGNQNGDDNPDLIDYMGYGELNFSRQIGNAQLLSGMVRGNPATGHGAVSFTWSVPSEEGWVFWGLSVFHGYGESLIAFDEETTRVMGGILLAR